VGGNADPIEQTGDARARDNILYRGQVPAPPLKR
jgi:hypothetical protein